MHKNCASFFSHTTKILQWVAYYCTSFSSCASLVGSCYFLCYFIVNEQTALARPEPGRKLTKHQESRRNPQSPVICESDPTGTDGEVSGGKDL